jgi:hypothetical protein
MVAGDINQDGRDELLVTTTNGHICAFNPDGTTYSGYPIDLGIGINSSPIVLGNGDIVLGTSDSHLRVLNASRQMVTNLPLPQGIAGSPIACDLDNDGMAEIVFCLSNGTLYAIEANGTNLNGFPVALGCTVTNPPVVADLDNDNNLEIVVFTFASNLFAVRSDGTQMPFSPISVGLIGNTPSTIADLDDDGDFELICGSVNDVLVFDCKYAKGTKAPWATYRGNPARTGFFPLAGTDSDTGAVVPKVTALKGNYPNPFNPETQIAFDLADNAKVSLRIFDTRGRLVRTLVRNEMMNAGAHSVSWNGTDDSRNPVGSGVYFYEMRGGKYTSVKKMILLK